MFIERVPSPRGQVLIMFALGLVGLFALVGLAIDAGNAFADRRNAQNAADNAAFAAALKKAGVCLNNPNCALSAFSGAGYAIAQKNGYSDGVDGDTVQVLWPPSADYPPNNPYAGNPNYLQVIIYSSFDTYFARVIGITTMQNHVSAIVRVKDSVVKPLYDGAAIVSLAPHGSDMFDVNGSAKISVTGGGFLVNSDYASCTPKGALNVGNNAGNNLKVPSITSVGNACGVPQQIPTTTGSDQWKYPVVEYILPEPSCAGEGSYDKATKTLSPGHYATFPPNSVGNDKPILFKKGVYCIDGGFKLNGGEDWYTKPGEGVLFYFTTCNSGNQCNVTFNGNSTINLEAMTDGSPYPGLLFYFAPNPSCDAVSQGGGCRTITINGDNGTDFTGTILAPDSYVKIDGGSQSYGLSSQVIAYNVGVTGTADVTIYFDQNEQLKLPTSPSIELMK